MSKKHHKHAQEQEVQDLPADYAADTAEEEELEEEMEDASSSQSAAAPADEYYEKYVRLSADFENFRKRTEREKSALLYWGRKEFAEKLLPAYEVLLRQRAQMEKDGEVPAEMKSLHDGLKMVLGELEKGFKAGGVEKLDVVGKPYDPETAEAIATLPAAAEQDGMVLEEVQMGFSLDGKVLRPARVVVGKASEA